MTILGPLPAEEVRSLAAKLHAGQLVLFVGAGISFQARSAGNPSARMPLWRDLAERTAAANHKNLSAYDGNLLDLFDDVAGTEGRARLEDSVREALRDDIFEPSQVHEIIASLPWHLVFTTNYDSLLKRAMHEPDAIVTEKDYVRLRRPASEQPRLIHLHGDLSNMHTLTGDDYDLWEERHPVAKATLVEAGLTKTFLFIGYSNSDPHLRHGLFPWIRKLGGGRVGRNFSWMWNASPEQIRVLRQVAGISVQPLAEDAEWLLALQQLANEYQQLKKLSTTKTFSSARRAATASASDPAKSEQSRLNGYKLFYHRGMQRMSVSELSKKSGVFWRRINRLESVSKTTQPGAQCFAPAKKSEIDSLESALGLRGTLEFGGGDDFLATYIMFYRVNRGEMRNRGANNQLSFNPTTKAIVFDFGGTLTLPNPPYNTWERLWLSVGYSISEASNLHRLFVANRISHQEWCNETCKMLKARGFSRDHLEAVAAEVRGVSGLQETITELSDRAIPMHIASGSIRQIIQKVLGEKYNKINDVKCNDILFDRRGLISEIRGHPYDFEGKSTFIERVINDRGCMPIEVLFVGNSLNDHWAIRSGARTLCVNPSNTDYTNAMVWSNYIKEMKDLREILQLV